MKLPKLRTNGGMDEMRIENVGEGIPPYDGRKAFISFLTKTFFSEVWHAR